jgi:hypothetical protein
MGETHGKRRSGFLGLVVSERILAKGGGRMRRSLSCPGAICFPARHEGLNRRTRRDFSSKTDHVASITQAEKKSVNRDGEDLRLFLSLIRAQ